MSIQSRWSAKNQAWFLGARTSQSLFDSMRCKHRAVETRMIYFPQEEKWIETPNEWRLGWSPEKRAFVASNRKRGWRFKDARGLEQFRLNLEAWDWAVSEA